MIDCAEYYEFIEAHADERVEDLALRLAAFPPEARTFILRQIEGRQRLRAKVPSWCEVPRLHFPPRLSLEQCSGEVTARYKAALVERRVENLEKPILVDLTGGLGVDFSFMAAPCAEAVYVERNPELVELAAHNFPCLVSRTPALSMPTPWTTFRPFRPSIFSFSIRRVAMKSAEKSYASKPVNPMFAPSPKPCAAVVATC